MAMRFGSRREMRDADIGFAKRVPADDTRGFAFRVDSRLFRGGLSMSMTAAWGARREAPEAAPLPHLARSNGGKEVAVARLVAPYRNVVQLIHLESDAGLECGKGAIVLVALAVFSPLVAVRIVDVGVRVP